MISIFVFSRNSSFSDLVSNSYFYRTVIREYCVIFAFWRFLKFSLWPLTQSVFMNILKHIWERGGASLFVWHFPPLPVRDVNPSECLYFSLWPGVPLCLFSPYSLSWPKKNRMNYLIVTWVPMRTQRIYMCVYVIENLAALPCVYSLVKEALN